MATATEVITASFRKLGIKDAETPLTTTEINDGIESLNDTMNQLEIEGFELGYADVSVGGDTVALSEAGYLNFVKLQLGVRIAQENEVNLNESYRGDLQAARRAVVRSLNRKALLSATKGTFQYFALSAVELLGVKSADEPVNTAELNNAVPYLNDCIKNLEAEGFGLGFQEGTALTDETKLPDWSYRWIKALLARELSSSYSVPTPVNVEQMIREGEENAYVMRTRNIKVEFPNTLPVGSSNEWYEDEYNYFGRDMSEDIVSGSNDGLTDSEGNPLLDTP
jgi:hypothetical protein